jgi:hypothetical protein
MPFAPVFPAVVAELRGHGITVAGEVGFAQPHEEYALPNWSKILVMKKPGTRLVVKTPATPCDDDYGNTYSYYERPEDGLSPIRVVQDGDY